MNLFMGVGTLAVAALIVAQGKPATDVVVVVGGDVHGYLSPCGCTKPMSGGIRRRAAAVRNLTAGRPALVLENGGLAHGLGRQDELKAEALAEALKSMGVDAVNAGSREAAMGKGMLEAIARLCGEKLVASQAAGALPLAPVLKAEGFVVGGASVLHADMERDLGAPFLTAEEAAEALLIRAGSQPAVLLLEGNETTARSLAQQFPKLRLIVYSSQGDPPSKPILVGETWLVTPGEKGKSVLRFRWRSGKFTDYTVVKLGPEIPDDPAVSRVFRTYLERVTKEGLLDKLPRKAGEKLAGNPTCGTCHIEAMGVWEKSKHAGALATLEEVGQDRDPDCVGCHVVALDSDKGFRSRALTPQFTDVGCESCHGAGGEHALDPSRVPMGKVGEASCMACHNREHSPEFDFATYWQKIKH